MACQPVEMFASPPCSLSEVISSASIVGYVSGSLTTPARRVAFDVVDVGLVERPGVDQALGAVFLVVDRPAVEPECFGEPVVVTGRQPGLLGGFQRLVGRIGQEGVDGHVQLRRRRQ